MIAAGTPTERAASTTIDRNADARSGRSFAWNAVFILLLSKSGRLDASTITPDRFVHSNLGESAVTKTEKEHEVMKHRSFIVLAALALVLVFVIGCKKKEETTS